MRSLCGIVLPGHGLPQIKILTQNKELHTLDEDASLAARLPHHQIRVIDFCVAELDVTQMQRAVPLRQHALRNVSAVLISLGLKLRGAHPLEHHVALSLPLDVRRG